MNDIRGIPATARTRKLLVGAATALVLVAGAAGASHAWAQRGHGDWSMDGGGSVEKIEHRVDNMLKRVAATPDQQARIHAIIEAAVKDIDPIRHGMAGTRAQTRTLLTAPQIDRAALETLRGQRIAAMDQISQRVTRAMEDGADVLSPYQRQKLATIAADREAHHPH